MTAQDTSPIRIDVSKDAMNARLIIPAGVSPEYVNEATIMGHVSGAHVHVSATVKQRVLEAIDEFLQNPAKECSKLIAVGTPPEHGSDSYLTFEPRFRDFHPDHTDDETGADAQPNTQDDTRVDHYNRSDIKLVQLNETIGRVHPASDGTDGVDVRGKTLAAKSGKPLTLRLDESIEQRSDGSLIARVVGSLEYNPPILKIANNLHVQNYVDFSIGNIDYVGDVTIDKGIRDCFKVTVTGSIIVHGLVEAAYLQANKDISLTGGMAGREKGVIKAGRDLDAKYLDNVTALIARDGRIKKEMINCRISTGRSFACEGGHVAGGTLIVGASCCVAQLGTPAGSLTNVVLGRIAELADLATEAADLMPQLEKRAKKAEQRLQQLSSTGGRLNSQQAEELTELQFQVSMSRKKLQPLHDRIERLNTILNSYTTVDLTVTKRIYAGVKLYAGTYAVEFTTDIKGPVRITMSSSGDLMIEDLAAKRAYPLNTIARVHKFDDYTGPTQAKPSPDAVCKAA